MTDLKDVTLQLRVRVEATVSDQAVAQQIGDAIDPDGWNWDVSFPEVVGSVPAADYREDWTPAAEAELAQLEGEFEAAGGRGVELAERIDELRAARDGQTWPPIEDNDC